MKKIVESDCDLNDQFKIFMENKFDEYPDNISLLTTNNLIEFMEIVNNIILCKYDKSEHYTFTDIIIEWICKFIQLNYDKCADFIEFKTYGCDSSGLYDLFN